MKQGEKCLHLKIPQIEAFRSVQVLAAAAFLLTVMNMSVEERFSYPMVNVP